MKTGIKRDRSASWLLMGLFCLLVASCTDSGKLHVLVIKAGGAHTCASLLNLDWKCWGYNNAGQLGQGNTANRGDAPGQMGNHLPKIDLGINQSELDIALGSDYSCGLLYDSSTGDYTVKCWGDNSTGQLGLGDTTDRGDAPDQMGDNLPVVELGTDADGNPLLPVAITAGQAHTCVLLRDVQLQVYEAKCWGDNSAGQLGQGNTDTVGDEPGEMGDNLPPIELGTDADGKALEPSAIAAGAYYTCVLLQGGEVKCWGSNAYGQLGQGDTVNRGDAPGEMGDNLPPIDLGTDADGMPISVVEIATGGGHACARLEGGAVKCWGDNSAGQLGQGNTDNIGDDPGEMGDALPAIDLGTSHQMQTDSVATTIAAGDLYACVLLDNETAKCWGSNTYGQLGQGDTANRGDAPGEMGNNLPPIDLGTGRTPVGLSAALFHVCTVFSSSWATCWGRNDVGQLGEGTTTNRGDQPGEMGNNLSLVDVGSWSHESY